MAGYELRCVTLLAGLLVGLLALTPGAAAATPRTITLDDNGKTIELAVGERFLLRLGAGEDWGVTVADPAVIVPIVNMPLPQGAQGLYEARQVGVTMLSAASAPPCRQNMPPCAQPTRAFSIQVRVGAGAALPGLPNTGGGYGAARAVAGVGLALGLLATFVARRRKVRA